MNTFPCVEFIGKMHIRQGYLKIVFSLSTLAIFCLFVDISFSPGEYLSAYSLPKPTRTKFIARQVLHRSGNASRNEIVLFWHGRFGNTPEGDALFRRLSCPVQSCSVSYKHKDLHKAAAVIFMCPSLSGRVPPHNVLDQRWIFYCHESPYLTPGVLHAWNNHFNWTMTHTLNSDIYLSFGDNHPMKYKKQKRSKMELMDIAKSKTKLVAWFVSNCNTQSKREQYVKQLQKFIPVDIYGRCGKLKLPNWNQPQGPVMSLLNETYLFYLSFENSLCPDYVTEKFFKILPYDVVPVVRSGANYSRFVPHKWYVNAANFPSPKELADYLLYLQQHPEKYIAYLEHREEYNFNRTVIFENQAFCNLCRKLNDPNEPVKSYANIESWWSRKDCKSPEQLNVDHATYDQLRSNNELL